MTKHVLCDISEVPQGSCKAFMIEGKRVAVYNVQGAFYVTQNHCTHKGAQLGKGKLTGLQIECPQHGWRFNVKTGECLAPSHGRKLRLYPVSIEHSQVTVELQDNNQSHAAVTISGPADKPTGKIEFHAAAKVDALVDEEVMEVTVGEEKIALYRLDGKYYATHGLCTHENVNLVEGFVEGDLIECPLHSACFNIKTGEVVSPPAEINLKTYPVKLEGNIIFIGIDAG